MRILLTGMGGQLGTQVARLFEARDDVESIVGYDLDPPRRRLRRSEFHRIDPRSARHVAELVRAADPTVVVHLGVYEPHARIEPTLARSVSVGGAAALAQALKQHGDVEHVVVRSGIEVYGRSRSGPFRPDETAVPSPTCGFGATLLEVEDRIAELDIPQTLLRLAPVVGSHVPSPLGRLLKLPVVPVGALGDPPFALLHADDAAAAVVAAAVRRPDGPVNVVGSGAVTAAQAARLGRRVPVPVFGFGWVLARYGVEVVSAPMPEHVRELLTRGRVADASRAAERLGVTPRWSTSQIVAELYQQSNVVYLPVEPEVAA